MYEYKQEHIKLLYMDVSKVYVQKIRTAQVNLITFSATKTKKRQKLFVCFSACVN